MFFLSALISTLLALPADTIRTEQIEEVVVTSNSAKQRILNVQAGAEQLQLKDLTAAPSLFGENDIMRSLQLLPGVKSESDASSSFQVRGGTAAQNLVLFDLAPVYNVGHLAGLFSAFNDDALGSATLYIDGIDQFVGWDLGAMSVKKEGDRFVLSDAADNLKLYLKPTGDGTYQETTTSTHMIGQGARFVAEKVGDVTTLTAYDDKMMLFTLVNCDDLIAYRNKAYRRILTSRFEPTADGLITITDDKMSGPILPDSPDISYFFVEDGKGDLTDKIRLSPGRYHLYFSPADKGLNLHFCSIDPETGEFDVSYDTENSLILRYAKDPGWSWLSTDVL